MKDCSLVLILMGVFAAGSWLAFEEDVDKDVDKPVEILGVVSINKLVKCQSSNKAKRKTGIFNDCLIAAKQ